MFIEVAPTGSKYWRLAYRFAGKQKQLALGVYPEVSLRLARERRDEARKLLTVNRDPGVERKVEKARTAGAESFDAVAAEWQAKNRARWSEAHAERLQAAYRNDLQPHLGNVPVRELNAPVILAALRRVEARGALEQARRCKAFCNGVMRYAVATGLADRNPVTDLAGAMETRTVRHHASITDPKKVGKLIRDIRAYDGFFVTKCALELLPLVFTRPGELRKAEWPEFDLDAAEWRIPAHRMKMREQHIVPLSKQAIAVLRRLHQVTGHRALLFPGVRHHDKPLSENTLNAALRYLGYGKDEITGHGFRSMASTLLNERGWNRDAIERQLAHAERDKIRGAYNYAEHLPARRRMMQAWADRLDALAEGAAVVPISVKEKKPGTRNK
jgi:integrase